MNKVIVISFLIALFAGNSNAQVANRYDIVIDELMADPTPQIGLPNNEWIELRNTSATAINLLGWRIGDAIGLRACHGVLPVADDCRNQAIGSCGWGRSQRARPRSGGAERWAAGRAAARNLRLASDLVEGRARTGAASPCDRDRLARARSVRAPERQLRARLERRSDRRGAGRPRSL